MAGAWRLIVVILCFYRAPLVFGQAPPNRTQTKPQVGIVVPRTSIVPSLFGMNRNEVARVLEPLRLQAKFTGLENGVAVGQEPAAGTTVKVGSAVVVTLGEMPRLVLSGPAAPAYAGSEVTFTAAFVPALPAGPKVGYYFTWGDGNPTESAANAVVTHKFADAGNLVVSVVGVIDGRFKVGSRVRVDILPPPPTDTTLLTTNATTSGTTDMVDTAGSTGTVATTTMESTTSSATATPTITTELTTTTILREWLAHGAAAFNAKDEMKQGEEETIALRISADQSDVALHSEMPGGKATRRWGQDVSQVMRAELTGETFKITALGPPEQLIHDGRFEWNWKVKPLKSGDHELQLVTSLLVPVPGLGPRQSVLHSDYRHVRVHVSAVFVVGQFLAEYWQWVTSSIAIPLLAWAWKKKREGKRGPKVGFVSR